MGTEERDTREPVDNSVESMDSKYLETSKFGQATPEELESTGFKAPATPPPGTWKPVVYPSGSGDQSVQAPKK